MSNCPIASSLLSLLDHDQEEESKVWILDTHVYLAVELSKLYDLLQRVLVLMLGRLSHLIVLQLFFGKVA